MEPPQRNTKLLTLDLQDPLVALVLRLIAGQRDIWLQKLLITLTTVSRQIYGQQEFCSTLCFSQNIHSEVNYIPFLGHDMKTEFERKCNPTFEIANVISKKDKLNDMNQYVEDFFRRIFVIDAKKRINFVDIAQHPVLAAHRNDFRENIDFYKNIKEDDEVKVRDPQHTQEYG